MMSAITPTTIIQKPLLTWGLFQAHLSFLLLPVFLFLLVIVPPLYLALFSNAVISPISPRNASWESTEKELKSKIPYALWDDPKNKIHKLLWELRELAITTINKNNNDPQYIWSRNHLDRGLASCSWWWAAEKKPDVFSPITWNPSEIEKGLKELINSIRSLQNIDSKTKLRAEKIYINLTKAIWNKHWKKYA